MKDAAEQLLTIGNQDASLFVGSVGDPDGVWV